MTAFKRFLRLRLHCLMGGIVGGLLCYSGRVATADSATPKTQRPRGDVSVKSDDGVIYTGDEGRVIYKKNVVVLDPVDSPRTIIRCDWLTLIRTAEGKVTEITAETNVVIHLIDLKGTNTLRGYRAVYATSNDTITISGDPPIGETPQSILIGDKLMIYERSTGRFSSPGRIEQRFGSSALLPLMGSTNKPPIPIPAPGSALSPQKR